ncbi:MAG: FMN-binding protein [Clostridia bacterium]|nr:FMN-binding protein [Clostridia bacterium]
MKNYIKSVGALTVICAVIAILLALTNSITAPVIEKNANAAANEALLIVLPDGEEFASVDLSSYELPSTVTEAFTEKNGGVVVKLTTSGYGSDMVIMVGVDGSGTVTGATCLSSNETLGYEKTYGESAIGSTVDTVDGIDVIAGATKTTAAYKGAVKDALNTAVIIGGGSVDVRTEEEILADNLNGALPEGEGEFESVFVAEAIDESITAVYKAVNGKGYVFVVGEAFVGADADGNVVTDVDDAVKTAVSGSVAAIINSEITELDISGYEMPKQIEKAYKTASGNYVFDLKASGFGINGDEYYNPSGEYIKIKVSVTEDGKIIACQTVSQKETDGIGSACEDVSFYSQFNGKTEADYGDIDAISGATITTNGYKTAVSKVFEAIKILKGEA